VIVKKVDEIVQLCFDCRNEVRLDPYNPDQMVCGCDDKEPVSEGGPGFFTFRTDTYPSWKKVYVTKLYRYTKTDEIWDLW
jgi:hypothetical protein